MDIIFNRKKEPHHTRAALSLSMYYLFKNLFINRICVNEL